MYQNSPNVFNSKYCLIIFFINPMIIPNRFNRNLIGFSLPSVWSSIQLLLLITYLKKIDNNRKKKISTNRFVLIFFFSNQKCIKSILISTIPATSSHKYSLLIGRKNFYKLHNLINACHWSWLNHIVILIFFITWAIDKIVQTQDWNLRKWIRFFW